jgi:hypothetical protein
MFFMGLARSLLSQLAQQPKATTAHAPLPPFRAGPLLHRPALASTAPGRCRPSGPPPPQPLKPLGWAETLPPSPLHGERRPLHAPSPLDQRITLFSSSSGCMNPPRSPSATTRILRHKTLLPVFNSVASPTPGHLVSPRCLVLVGRLRVSPPVLLRATPPPSTHRRGATDHAMPCAL